VTTAHHPTNQPTYHQPTFDELGEPLRELTFVVVDLETTGGSSAEDEITEIGAVKVRGGEVVGEFGTLVNPGRGIPPYITLLTGITERMVVEAPPIGPVLASFLEFAQSPRGAVLVAHNAPFDTGFLKIACARTERPWPPFRVLDTAVLARRVLTRDETPDCKLATLARRLRTPHQPTHRALDDARATVDVLHALFERVGNLGVQTWDELISYTRAVPPEVRRKRHLAADLPHAPGVYLFRDHRGEALYVGKSTDLRNRVRSYFVSGEQRTRIREMVALAERVDTVVCAHGLEAEVRELRLIAGLRPRYNRRSKFPERSVFVKLTPEVFPRLSLVRKVLDDGAVYLGPFGSSRLAQQAMTAVHEVLPLRQCTHRLTAHSRINPCALAELGRCGAPCAGHESVDAYARHAADFRTAVSGDPSRIVDGMLARIDLLGVRQRYEDAAAARDRLAAFLRAAIRYQRLVALTGVAELVAARPAFAGGWELAVVRYGRLAAASTAPPGVSLPLAAEELVATAETVLPGPGPTPAATAEETECLLRWLDEPGVTVLASDGVWSSPAAGAARLAGWLARVDEARGHREMFRERVRRPESRPARLG
jgi:DNA polymerase-3 subunit epsilon